MWGGMIAVRTAKKELSEDARAFIYHKKNGWLFRCISGLLNLSYWSALKSQIYKLKEIGHTYIGLSTYACIWEGGESYPSTTPCHGGAPLVWGLKLTQTSKQCSNRSYKGRCSWEITLSKKIATIPSWAGWPIRCAQNCRQKLEKNHYSTPTVTHLFIFHRTDDALQLTESVPVLLVW